MSTETEAMELWQKALEAYESAARDEYGYDEIYAEADPAAASIIAAALKERDARIEAKDRALARIAASYVGWTSERVELLRDIARQALEADNGA